MTVTIILTWQENYGDRTGSLATSFKDAGTVVLKTGIEITPFSSLKKQSSIILFVSPSFPYSFRSFHFSLHPLNAKKTPSLIALVLLVSLFFLIYFLLEQIVKSFVSV